jgi:hypothetical protein
MSVERTQLASNGEITMYKVFRSGRVGVAFAALAFAASSLSACDSDKSSNAGTAGTSGAGGLAMGGSSGSAAGSAGGSAGPDGGTTLSLYDRLGGKTGLEMFVKTVVETKILTDADLKTFFFNQVATPIPAGHPSAAQITVCFARFVGAALGADAYPGTAVADATNTNTPSFTCRSMVEAHQGASTMLHIGSGSFDKFVGYIAASLMPLVKPTATEAGEITQAEFDTLAAALNGQKAGVTTPGASATLGPFPN